jgi:hypothetical protein
MDRMTSREMAATDSAGVERQSDSYGSLAIHAPLRLVTKSSVWIVEPERCMRLPQGEGLRAPTLCTDDALDDASWVHRRGTTLVPCGAGSRLLIVPAYRPPGSQGTRPGHIVEASMDLPELVERSVR